MNLDHYLEQATAGGIFESEGGFGVSPEKLLEKLGQHALTETSHGPLALVAAAVGAAADRLSVTTGPCLARYRMKMAEPRVETLQQMWEEPLSQRLLWALAVQRRSLLRAELSYPNQGITVVLTPEACKFSRGSRRREQVRVELVRPEPQPNLDNQVLQRHCSLCPIPIEIDGRPLQGNLIDTYRNRVLGWSSSVPRNLCAETGDLDSSRALFLYSTRSRKPTWVAVVGGVSYPFLIPEIEGKAGIVWSEQLRTDLGVSRLVPDSHWESLRQDLIAACD